MDFEQWSPTIMNINHTPIVGSSQTVSSHNKHVNKTHDWAPVLLTSQHNYSLSDVF